MDGCQWSEQIRMTKLYTKPRHHQASHLPVCHTDALNHHRLIVCVPVRVCACVCAYVCVRACVRDWCPLPSVNFTPPPLLSSPSPRSLLSPPQSKPSRKHEALGDSGVLSQPALRPALSLFLFLVPVTYCCGKSRDEALKNRSLSAS